MTGGVVAAILLFSLAVFPLALSSSIRGGDPSTDYSSLKCVLADLPGSKPVSVESSMINDDYCDCVDGIDEPGTSACGNGSFYCRNRGAKPKVVPASWVDDGHCDCCDGSDERSGCEDRCEEEGRKRREEVERRVKMIMKGARAREKYASDGQRLILEDKEKLARLEKEVDDVKKEIERQKKYIEALERAQEQAESLRLKKDGSGCDAESPSPEKSDFGDGKQTKSSVPIEEASENDAAADPERVAPNENEDAAWEGGDDYDSWEEDDYSSEKFRDDFAEDNGSGDGEGPGTVAQEDSLGDTADHADALNASPGSPRSDGHSAQESALSPPKQGFACPALDTSYTGLLRNYLKYVRLRFARFFGTDLSAGGTSNLSSCSDEARSLLREAEEKQRNLLEEIADLEKRVKRDYGSQDYALRRLDGICHKSSLLQYDFEHCVFDEVRQYENGQMIAKLGRFHGWDDGEMVYKNGDRCWNGPSRSVKVKLQCGEPEEVLAVDESQRCVYNMRFKTPAVCDRAMADELRQSIENLEGIKTEL